MIHSFHTPTEGIALPKAFTFPFHYTPHPLTRLAADEVRQYLLTRDDWQEELRQGKMFGVLVIKNSEGKLVRCDCPTEGERYIDGVATGCLFIKRGVFSKLEAPYFEFKYDPKSRAISEGEDLGFCKKVSELGYKFYVNFALACDHEKKVSLLAVSNYAMTFASDAINAYDKQFRSSLTRFKMQQQMAKQEEAKSKLILPERFK